jgi:hypothetical protein
MTPRFRESRKSAGRVNMSESDFRKLIGQFDRLETECDTPEKATAQLQKEGLVDEAGRTAQPFRDAQ